MEPHWLLIEALLQGTYGIRKGHRKYLPQEPRELDEVMTIADAFNACALLRQTRADVGGHVDPQACAA